MFITAEEIEEIAGSRPYRDSPDSTLSSLLDAFEEFVPSVESYSASAETILRNHAEHSEARAPEALNLAETAEPTVSRSILEILSEIVARDLEADGLRRARYEGWAERGFFYGFDTAALEDTAKLIVEES